MEHHLVLSSNGLETHSLDNQEGLSSLRTDERIQEILGGQDGKEPKVEDIGMRNYKPEDFLMLLPQESSGETYVPPPNPFQSACTMCSTCKRVLVFPAGTEEAIQCPACKKFVDIDTLSESKLLRSCPQCDTLLGNPTNSPKVLCPLCMKLIEWNSIGKDPSSAIISDVTIEQPKRKRQRKSKDSLQIQQQQQQQLMNGNSSSPDGTPILGGDLDDSSDSSSNHSKKKKGYVKKGEPGYVRPKYSYVKKGQPGYVRPKYSYVKKGQPGKRKDGHDGMTATLLNSGYSSADSPGESEGMVREVTDLVRHA